jgi:ATP-binding cassette, subfamily B, bacterial PglK
MLMLTRAISDTLRLLGPGRRWRWLLLVLLALAIAGFEAIGAMLIYVLMGLTSGPPAELALPGLEQLPSPLADLPPRALQLSLAGLVAVFFLGHGAVLVGQTYIQARLVHNAGARIASHLVRGYLALPYLTHTQMNSSELVRNAFDSVQHLVRQVMKPAVEVVAEVTLVVGLTIVLLVVAPQATLIALVVLGPAVGLLLMIIQPRLKRLGREAQESRRHSLQALQQALGAVRDIRLLGREQEFATVFKRQRRIMARTEYMEAALSKVPRALIESGMVLVIVVIFILAVLSDDDGAALVPTLGVFAYVGFRLQPSLRKIVQGLNHVRFGTAIIDDLLQDRQRVDAVLESRTRRPVAVPRSEDGFRRSIELRDVAFSYADGAPPALVDVNLRIERGESIGICGPTGGGKSTLVDLISGLLHPSSGEVLVDGRPLDDHPSWWYAELGVVSQSVYLLDGTLRQNIAFGRRDDDIDEELLHRSVERSQLQEVVKRLPLGLETPVGERGIKLSGGQRQRVAIARALYREPSVIIFDEGTSALDAATEGALVAALDDLRVGRTLISVAHRIATVRHVDRIIVVNGGRIVHEGGYAELLDHSALFRQLAG